MRSAKSEAVIQQNAAVCDVDTLNIYGKALAKILADGEVERGVRLEMIAGNRWIPIRRTQRRSKRQSMHSFARAT